MMLLIGGLMLLRDEMLEELEKQTNFILNHVDMNELLLQLEKRYEHDRN